MRRSHALRLTLTLALGAIALIAAGCGDNGSGSAAGTTTTAGPARTSTTGGSTSSTNSTSSTVQLVDSAFGKILATGDGRTLYVFTPDTGTQSTCTGGCASAWPPLPGPAAGSGVGADDLGTTTRSDGSVQATFYGHPVYTYGGDAAPGDTTGQGVGGKWYVVDAAGKAVTTAAGSGAAASTTVPTTTTPSRGGY